MSALRGWSNPIPCSLREKTLQYRPLTHTMAEYTRLGTCGVRTAVTTACKGLSGSAVRPVVAPQHPKVQAQTRKRL